MEEMPPESAAVFHCVQPLSVVKLYVPFSSSGPLLFVFYMAWAPSTIVVNRACLF